MKIRRITIQRVYPIRDYENIRLQFEIELEDGENPREVIFLANNEIMTIERVLAMFQYAQEEYRDLEENYVHKDRFYANIFQKYREETRHILEEKHKTLGCLESVDTTNIEALTVCMEELGIKSISQIEEKKKTLREKIKKIEEHLKTIDAVEEEYEALIDEYGESIAMAKDEFIKGNYKKAYEILDNIRNKISQMKTKIANLNPDKYKYEWR